MQKEGLVAGRIRNGILFSWLVLILAISHSGCAGATASNAIEGTLLVSPKGTTPGQSQTPVGPWSWANWGDGTYGPAPSSLDNTIYGVSANGLLLVWINWDGGPEDGGDRTFQSISDDDPLGNTYHQLDIQHGYLGSGGSDTTRLYWTINQSEGDRTVTFTVADSTVGHFNASFIVQYTGIDTSSPIDAVSWTSYLAGEVGNPTADITINAPNEIVVSILGAGGSQSPDPNDDWNLWYVGDASIFPFGLQDNMVPTSGLITVAWSADPPEPQGYGIWNVAVKLAQASRPRQ
jgi:hypothetical protein